MQRGAACRKMFAYRGRPRLGLRDLVVALVDVGAGDGLLEAELLLRLGGTGYNYFQCTRYSLVQRKQ